MTQTAKKTRSTKAKSAAEPKSVAEPKSTSKLNGMPANGAAAMTAANPAKVAMKNNVVEMAAPASVSHDAVALLAFRYWRERGGAHGQHEDDWRRAEAELRGMAS
ncbi:MAG: DUF2934 domain-containing protein [Terracidiphilus sp.]